MMFEQRAALFAMKLDRIEGIANGAHFLWTISHPSIYLQLLSVSPMLVDQARSSRTPASTRRTALAREAGSTVYALACRQFSLHDRGQPPGSPYPARSQMAH